MKSDPVTPISISLSLSVSLSLSLPNGSVTIAEATNGYSLSPVVPLAPVPRPRPPPPSVLAPRPPPPPTSDSPSFERLSGGSNRDPMKFSGSKNCVIIRPTASVGGKKPKDDEEIPEELAVCSICSGSFAEENVLKTKCNCKTGPVLVHDQCASHHRCEHCEQDVEIIPVTLLRLPISTKTEKRKSKKHLFGRRMKRPAR